jgi:N6-L-threonylcarbamoyladenine synthase
MVGVAACQRLQAGQSSAINLGVAPRLALEEADGLYGDQPPF